MAVPVDPLITIVIIGTDTAVRIEARGSQRFIVDLRIGNVVEAGLDTAGIVRGIAYECIVIGIIGGTGLTGNGQKMTVEEADSIAPVRQSRIMSVSIQAVVSRMTR